MQNVVAKLVHHQLLDQEADAHHLLFSLLPKGLHHGRVLVHMGALENLVHLLPNVLTFETLLEHVGAEFELGETHEVLGNR